MTNGWLRFSKGRDSKMITEKDIIKYKKAIDKVWLPMDNSKDNQVWGEMFDYFDYLLVTGRYDE